MSSTATTVFGNKKKIIIGTSVIICALFGIGVSLASFGIGHDIWDVMCDNNSFMPLPIWVMTAGCIIFVYSVVTAVLYFIKHTNPIRFLGIFSCVACFFTLPFAVMGTMLMAQYSGPCYKETYSLWAISLTALITNWILVVIIFTLIILFIIDLVNTYRNTIQVN